MKVTKESRLILSNGIVSYQSRPVRTRTTSGTVTLPNRFYQGRSWGKYFRNQPLESKVGYTGGNGNSELIEIETVFMDSFSGYE